jgi:hypothetical protein
MDGRGHSFLPSGQTLVAIVGLDSDATALVIAAVGAGVFLAWLIGAIEQF